MAIISITITESSIQVLAGIPKNVTVETNTPASIFYTLDGTVPTTDSAIYTGPIALPTSGSIATLNVFATDGVDSSPVVTKIYTSNIVGIRNTHDSVTNVNEIAENRLNLFPFGDAFPEQTPEYGAMAGITVDSPGIPNIPDGYDGTATGTSPGGTDLPLSSYQFIYSESDSEGNRGHGIGTLPANVTIRIPEPINPSESSNINSKFFNPKALVIYQDNRETPFDPNMSQINRQFFAMENPEKVRTGALLFNTALDGLQPTGSLVRSQFNPKDQTITYYYFDSSVLRWIISTEPFQPKNPNAGILYNIVFSSRDQGAGLVFRWLPFVGRRLI
ncbi:MAG TPA: chitobiase/beta-hexosaminidase C-terminal domain-containing protein [Anaerovoracaceae bacterium]|nr:chitobiase/beta-hexosaminidase C-terminal domain-containing protein [Anaerovoracaceae bacterium]